MSEGNEALRLGANRDVPNEEPFIVVSAKTDYGNSRMPEICVNT